MALTVVALLFAHASAMSVGNFSRRSTRSRTAAPASSATCTTSTLAAPTTGGQRVLPATYGRGAAPTADAAGGKTAARGTYDRKVPCLNEGDVGCVLPLAARAAAARSATPSASTRSVAYPDEQGGEQWRPLVPAQGRLGQCDRFYSFCACSCGYRADARAARRARRRRRAAPTGAATQVIGVTEVAAARQRRRRPPPPPSAQKNGCGAQQRV